MSLYVYMYPQRLEEGVGFPGAGGIGGCKVTQHRFWEWKLGPLQEKPVLLATELPLQLHKPVSFRFFPLCSFSLPVSSLVFILSCSLPILYYYHYIKNILILYLSTVHCCDNNTYND